MEEKLINKNIINNNYSYRDEEQNYIEDYPAIYKSREKASNSKNREKANDVPKFIPLKNHRNLKIKLEENSKKLNSENSLKIISNNNKTPNNLTIKKIDLNLNLPSEENVQEYNFLTKSKNNNINKSNIPKTVNHKRSIKFPNVNMNKSKLKENLKSLPQNKSLFLNKNIIDYNTKNSQIGKNLTNEDSIQENKAIEFNSSKMNNFEYSFMENKSKDNLQKKLEITNLPLNNISDNKSYLMKSEENSHIIKNVDNIFNSYENYDDGISNKKVLSALSKIPKYFGINNPNRKLKINLPSLKKEHSYKSNLGLSPINNPNYSTNAKSRMHDLSTNDNVLTNPNNILNTSNNNKNNYQERNYKISPINANYAIPNIFSKKALNNNYAKIKKVVFSQYNN